MVAKPVSLNCGCCRSSGLSIRQFRGIPGARRISRIRLDDASIESAEGGYVVEFTLPKGSFATSVMRELMKDGNLR